MQKNDFRNALTLYGTRFEHWPPLLAEEARVLANTKKWAQVMLAEEQRFETRAKTEKTADLDDVQILEMINHCVRQPQESSLWVVFHQKYLLPKACLLFALSMFCGWWQGPGTVETDILYDIDSMIYEEGVL